MQNHAALPHVLLVLDQFPKPLAAENGLSLDSPPLLPQYGYRASILTFFVHPESAVLASPPCPIYVLPLRRTYDLNAFVPLSTSDAFSNSNESRSSRLF